jgi:hypothetical protein
MHGLPVPGQYPLPLVTSAYANDITIFLTKDEGFLHLLNTFMIYGAISGATLNMQKTKGLCVGAWRNRKDKPLGLKWSSEGGKFLGIYIYIYIYIYGEYTDLAGTELDGTEDNDTD